MALQLVANFLEAEVPIPFWWRSGRLQGLMESYKNGFRPTIYTLPWTTTGPNVLTWALRTTGEIKAGQHWHTYYQFQSALEGEFLKPDVPADVYEHERVRFVHLYGETKIHMRDRLDGLPPPNS